MSPFTKVCVGSLISLAVVAACSSSSNNDQQAAVCGNGVLENGEGCDGPLTLTCAQATMGLSTVGTVTCNACQLDTSGCQTSAGTGGSLGAAGATVTPIGAGGGPSGSGGLTGNGGFVG